MMDPYTMECIVRLKHEEAARYANHRARTTEVLRANDGLRRSPPSPSPSRGWLRSVRALVMRRIAPRAHGRSAT
jgi:hypothetical protein